MHRKQSGLQNKSYNFELFWKVLSGRNLSNLTTLFILTLSFAQISFFHLLGFHQYYDNPDRIFSYIVSASWYLNMLNLGDIGSVLLILVRAVAFSITMLFLINYMVLYYSIKHEWNLELPVKVMRFLYTYYNFILLFPCLQIFFFDVFCNTDVLTSLGETCREGAHLVFWIMGLVGLFVAAYMTIVKHWYSMNGRFDKKNAFAGENKKFEIIFTVIKTSLAFLTALEVDAIEYKRFYISYIFILSLLFVIAFIYFMPYAKPVVEYFCFAWIIIFFVENFTMVVYLIVAEGQTVDVDPWYISVHFIIYLIVIAPAALFIYFKRQQYLILKKNVGSVPELMRQTFLFLRFNQNTGTTTESETLYRGIIEDHIASCKEFKCFCKEKELYDPKKGKAFPFENRYLYRSVTLKFFLRSQLELKVRTNPYDPELLLFYAEFLFNKFRNTHLALYQILKVSEMRRFLNPTLKYKLFKLFYTISEYINTRNIEAMQKPLEIENAIWVEEQFRAVLESMKKISQTALSFWGYLLNKSIELKTFNQKAKDLTEIVDNTTALWGPLKPYLEKQKKMKYFYNWYLKDFLNKKLFLSEEDMENILEEENASVHSADFINSMKDDHVIFQEDSCVVHISGNAMNMGKIIKTNRATQEVFGFEKSELEGSFVNILMPEMIAKNHGKYLETFVSTGRTRLLYNQRLSYAKHKRGYIFPIWIIVKQLNDARGEVQYVGLLRPMRVSKEEEAHYLLMNAIGEIQGMSRRLCHDLLMDPELLRQSSMNILLLAPKLIKWLSLNQLLENIKRTKKTITKEHDVSQDESRIEKYQTNNNFARMKSMESQNSYATPKLKKVANAGPISPPKGRDIYESGRVNFADMFTSQQKPLEEITWDELIQLDEEDFDEEEDAKLIKKEDDSDKIVEFTMRIPKKIHKFLKEYENEKSRYTSLLLNNKQTTNFGVGVSHARTIILKNESAEDGKTSNPVSKILELKYKDKVFDSVSNLQSYIDANMHAELYALKKIAKQIITTPKEKSLYRIKAIIITDYYGQDEDPIKCLKILSVQNCDDLITMRENKSLAEKSKMVRQDSLGSRNTETKNINAVTAGGKASHFRKGLDSSAEEPGSGLKSKREDSNQGDDTDQVKIRRKDSELQDLASKKTGDESLNRRIAEVKASVMASSTNIFEKEENVQCGKHLESLSRVKWFMRILFLAIIPINIIIYLLGAYQTLQFLDQTITAVLVNQGMLFNYNQIQDAIVTFMMISTGYYTSTGSTLTSTTISQLQDLKHSNLYNSIDYIVSENYDNTWLDVVFSEIKINVDQLLIDQLESAVWGDSFDGLYFNYDEVFREIFNSAIRLGDLDVADITYTQTDVQFFNQNVKKQVTANLGDVINFEIQELDSQVTFSENLSTWMLVGEVIMFALSLIVLFKLILNVIYCFRVILEVFSFIDDAKIKETQNYYRRLLVTFKETLGGAVFDDNASTVSRKSKAATDRGLLSNEQRNQKKLKTIEDQGFLSRVRARVLFFYLISVLVCCSFTVIFQVTTSKMLDRLQVLLNDGKFYFDSITNIPDMMMSLKQLQYNATSYELFIAPNIQLLIEELGNISKIVPLEETGYDFEVAFNQITFKDACTYFEGELNAQNYTSYQKCTEVALGKLAGGVFAFKQYFKDKALSQLTLSGSSQVNEVDVNMVYELDMGVETLKIIITKLLEMWETESKSRLQWTNNLLIGIIVGVSVLNIIMFIVAENLVAGTLRRTFFFYREVYNRNMLMDALTYEKRIKALLVKSKILQK